MNEEVLSDADFDALIAEAKQTFQWFDDFKVRFAADKKNHREKLAGPLTHEMLASREAAQRYLEHPERDRRLAALMMLLDHWGPNEQLARHCETLAFSDADDQVRGVALSGLAKCFAQTKDARVLRLLADIVRDERQPDSFRNSAYFGLFHVADVDARSLPDPDFRFPDDVDWDFVASCSKMAG